MGSRRPPPVRLAAALSAAVILLALGSIPVHADTEGELDAAKARLNQLIGEIESGQAVVASLRSEANDLAGRIDQVRTRISQTQDRIAQTQQEMSEAQKELDGTQEQLDRRAWVAYETGPGTSLDILLGATSLADLANRLQMVNQAARGDRDLIISIQSLETKLDRKKETLKALEDDLHGVAAGLDADYTALKAKLSAQQQAVAQLEANRSEAAALVDQLDAQLQAEIEAEKKRLAELERQREQQRSRAGGGSGSGGGGGGGGGGGVFGHPFQVCPVAGPVAYSDDFGAPRSGHVHAGNDMIADRGIPVVAPFSGTASDASNGTGGLSVNVYGSQGYVYNAHLDSIVRLGAVSAGDVIGTVGNTGNASGGITHNHFEWHPNNPSAWATWTSPYGYSIVGDAVDPYPYLNQVC